MEIKRHLNQEEKRAWLLKIRKSLEEAGLLKK